MSTKTKFTPGPWTKEFELNNPNEFSIVASHDAHICEVHGGQTADAHLIAASPEMYAALEFLVEFCQFAEHDRNDPAIAKVWAALAKARGES